MCEVSHKQFPPVLTEPDFRIFHMCQIGQGVRQLTNRCTKLDKISQSVRNRPSSSVVQHQVDKHPSANTETI